MRENYKYIEPLKILIDTFNNYVDDMLDNYRIIEILEKIIDNDPLTEEEKSLCHKKQDYLNNLFNDTSYGQTISFIIDYLNPNGINLEDSQVSMINNIIDKLRVSNKQEDIINMYDINRRVLHNIEDGKPIDYLVMDDVKYILFTEYSLLSDYIKDSDITMRSISDIISNIIKYNASFTSEEVIVDSYEEETSKKEFISEETIKSLLDQFGYVGIYDSLANEAKEYIIKHAEENKVKGLLDALKQNNIILKTGKDYGRVSSSEKTTLDLVFAKIIASSSKEDIAELKEIFSEYNEASLSDFVNKYQRVLIPEEHIESKRKKSKKDENDDKNSIDSQQGCKNNFILNTKFFKELGFNLDYIYNKADSILVSNYKIVKSSYETFSKIYGIEFDKEKPVGVTAFIKTPASASRILDWFIESTPRGYEYIKNNPTVTVDPIKKLYQIKLAGDEIFHELSSRGIVKYHNPGSAPNERIYKILNLSRDQLITEFDHNDEYTPVSRRAVSLETSKYLDSIVELSDDKEVYDWTSDSRVLNNKYIQYLENNCRVPKKSPAYPAAYDYLYIYNGTCISRKKVFRIVGLLMDAELFDSDITNNIKYALSYNSLMNEKNLNDINELTDKMVSSYSKK